MRVDNKSRSADHQQAQVLGIVLGTQQAEEHLQLTGAPQLDDRSLVIMARMAWKYEARAKVADERAMETFVQAYVVAYRFEPNWHGERHGGPGATPVRSAT